MSSVENAVATPMLTVIGIAFDSNGTGAAATAARSASAIAPGSRPAAPGSSGS